ncbi:MAG: ASCH domain-containing protein [Candidatus Bathyarchaeota archaeon]|nr:ASCH domain-containing protein [Candidatus Bathyarchaeota archaeon]
MSLLFKSQYVTMITEGRKTQTRRPRNPNLQIGQTIRLKRGYALFLPDSIQVTDIYKQHLGDMTAHDIICEGFHSHEEFQEAWMNIYGDWNPEQLVWVIEFKHIKHNETFKEKRRG